MWPGIPSHDHTRHTGLDLPQVQEKGKGRRRENVWCHFIWLKEDLEAVRENIADDGHYKIREIRKFIKLLLSSLNLMVPGPILAVYCIQLMHTVTCPFSKYFQILYIFAQIFKYFALSQHFLALFLKNPYPFPYFLEQALGVLIRA